MKTTFLCGCAVVVISILPAQAGAQTASGTDDAADSVIIVTANKRAQNLQDVASAVTAVTTEALEDRGFNDPSDLVGIVPSMSGGSLRGDTALAIRGVGLTVLGSAPGVAVHVDGVYQPRPQMADIAQVDISRVEVLRGPQGTLYGRNANGGVINFMSTKAGTEIGGYARASYATFNEHRIEGAINLPFSDNVRLRVTGKQFERRDGFVENLNPNGSGDVDKGRSVFARARLDVDVTPDLSLTLTGTYANRKGEFIYFTNLGRPIPQAITQNPVLASVNLPLAPRTTRQNDPVSQDRTYKSAAGIIEWSSGDFGVKSITAYQHYKDQFAADFDALEISLTPRQDQQEARTFTQELNFTVNSGPISAVFGGFYMHDEFSNRLDFTFPLGLFQLGSPAPLPPRTRLTFSSDPYVSKTKAVFADVTLKLTERLRLLAGVRHSDDSQRIAEVNGIFVQTPGGPRQIPPAACPNPGNPTGTAETDFQATTPRFGLQYDVSGGSNLYGTYSQGFKVGGFNYRGGCGAQYGSEKLKAYEIGSKNRFGDLTLNLAAFYYDYQDLQVEQLIGLAFVLQNAPSARIYGLEAEVSYVSGPFSLNGSATYMNARYGGGFRNLDILNPAAGLQDTRGNPLSNAPDFSFNLGGGYRTDPVIAGGTLTFRGDLSYKSRIFFREFGNVADSQAAYLLADASITWRDAAERFSVRVFGRNLTGQDYLQALAQSSATGTRFGTWGAPRQIGLELGFNF